MSAAPPTRFRAACTECRAATELDVDEFRLTVGRTRERTFYTFTCPDCGTAVRRTAGERIVEALTGAGVRTMRLHLGEQSPKVP
ncbi:hypothetical protein GXW83_11775 [Streptacidiphilus sp. PB12-B1b]|uniref:hypothetical protein n=1 Tax=Streptacidiphilus sp. PB12-B1b TaxID=2705012 RepID=UPI0015F8EEFB|nr:hypothetical protein [Streptacidiphilus sp. PB12-B1b]QMU76319.1 hypothetical protein GXW83_11775 [Streptacidiphilus sp. PB12-B1b]